MPDLARVVAAAIERWNVAVVEEAVFGTADPARIASMLDRFCRGALGAAVAGGLFYDASVGCVAGIRLDDGREVVVKVHQPRWTPSLLEAVARVQADLARAGFPCAAPIVGPLPLGATFAMAESFVPDPGQDTIEPEMLEVSAGGLARQVELCRSLDPSGLDHPFAAPKPSALYPEPHSPLFDFSRRAEEAAWIDDLARAALRAREDGAAPAAIVHGDWSARNVRLGHDRVLAAYDWDSLAFVPESTAVGVAAATWSALGRSFDTVAPGAEEVASYVRCYERERSRPFTRAERTAIGGASLYALAYTARCEHAIDPDGVRNLRARPRLARDGDALLRLADFID